MPLSLTTLLETVVNSYDLAQQDFKQIAQIMLTSIHFTVWMLEWRQLCTVQAMDNLCQSLGHVLRPTGAEALMGEGQYVLTAMQARLPVEALQQPKELTLRVFHKVLDSGLATTSFVSIRQGADEPFIKFLDKLKVALDKQIDNITAQEILLKQLAVENTNPDCQKVLQPLQAPTVVEMLKACQGIGTASHNMTWLSEALAMMSACSGSSVCFSIREAGSHEKQMPPEQEIPGTQVYARISGRDSAM